MYRSATYGPQKGALLVDLRIQQDFRSSAGREGVPDQEEGQEQAAGVSSDKQRAPCREEQSGENQAQKAEEDRTAGDLSAAEGASWRGGAADGRRAGNGSIRSEEHTSELQSRQYLVCR